MELRARDIWRHYFDWIDRVIFIAAIFFALAFIGLKTTVHIPLLDGGAVFIKALPAAYFGLLVIRHTEGNRGILLALGFFFAAGGDMVMELNAKRYLLVGLGLFSAMLIFYILAFRKDFIFSPRWNLIAVLTALAGIGFSIYIVFLPGLKNLRLPFILHAALLTLTVIFALYRLQGSGIVFYGSLFFFLSNAIQSLNMFMIPDDLSTYAVIISYYLAQLLIVWGHIFDYRVNVFAMEDFRSYGTSGS